VRSRSSLGEYAACAKEGGSSKDLIVASLVQNCRERLTDP